MLKTFKTHKSSFKFKNSKLRCSNVSSMFSSELNPNLDRFVILLPCLGHLTSLHHFLFARNWNLKLKAETRGVTQFWRKYFLESDINCALKISSSYTTFKKRLLLMFQLSFENLVKRDLEYLKRDPFPHMLLVWTINHIAWQGHIFFWQVRNLFII